jgi:hypothetical protein
MVVEDAKDLKPFRVILLRCTILRWSGAGKSAEDESEKSISQGPGSPAGIERAV